MNNDKIRIAHLDDESAVLEWFKEKCEESPKIKYMGNATTGEEFIRKFKSTPLDIVIIDISLEFDEEEGPEIAKEFLRQRREESNLPKIILLSRWVNYAYKKIANDLDASLINKKILPEDLISHISLIHGGARLILDNPNSKHLFRKTKNQGVKLAVKKLLDEKQQMIACMIRNGQTAQEIANDLDCEFDHINYQISIIKDKFRKIVKSENINNCVVTSIMERSGLCGELDLHDLGKLILST